MIMKKGSILGVDLNEKSCLELFLIVNQIIILFFIKFHRSI